MKQFITLLSTLFILAISNIAYSDELKKSEQYVKVDPKLQRNSPNSYTITFEVLTSYSVIFLNYQTIGEGCKNTSRTYASVGKGYPISVSVSCEANRSPESIELSFYVEKALATEKVLINQKFDPLEPEPELKAKDLLVIDTILVKTGPNEYRVCIYPLTKDSVHIQELSETSGNCSLEEPHRGTGCNTFICKDSESPRGFKADFLKYENLGMKMELGDTIYTLQVETTGKFTTPVTWDSSRYSGFRNGQYITISKEKQIDENTTEFELKAYANDITLYAIEAGDKPNSAEVINGFENVNLKKGESKTYRVKSQEPGFTGVHAINVVFSAKKLIPMGSI